MHSFQVVGKIMGFSAGASGKNLPANAEDVRDVGLIPGPGRSFEKEIATLSNIPARKIPWQAAEHGVPKIRTQLKRWRTVKIIIIFKTISSGNMQHNVNIKKLTLEPFKHSTIFWRRAFFG